MEGLVRRARDSASRDAYAAELACPPLPEALAYLWRIYRRLRRRKSGAGFGPAAIEWLDLDAFTRLTGMPLAPWEIEVIEELDDLFLEANAPQPMQQDEREAEG